MCTRTSSKTRKNTHAHTYIDEQQAGKTREEDEDKRQNSLWQRTRLTVVF